MVSMPKALSWLTLASVVSIVAIAAPASADDTNTSEARAHFEAGVALLQDPDGARYEDAYREFRAAYASSRSPRVLGNIGFCAMKLERDLEAIDAYSRYLEEVSDIDPIEREQMRRDLATLRSGVVRVNVNVSPPNARIIDVRKPVRGDAISNVYTAENGQITIGLRPGQHSLRARFDERDSPAWELDATPASTHGHAFVVPPPEARPAPIAAPPPPSRTLPFLTMGLGAAVLAAGGVTGYLAFRRVDSISSSCPNGECPATYDLEGEQKKAKTFATASDVLLVSGGVVVLGGLTWLAFSGSGSAAPRERPHEPTLRASAGCAGAGCMATVGGRF